MNAWMGRKYRLDRLVPFALVIHTVDIGDDKGTFQGQVMASPFDREWQPRLSVNLEHTCQTISIGATTNVHVEELT